MRRTAMEGKPSAAIMLAAFVAAAGADVGWPMRSPERGPAVTLQATQPLAQDCATTLVVGPRCEEEGLLHYVDLKGLLQDLKDKTENKIGAEYQAYA